MDNNFFFCDICNRNQIKNKRHIYSKNHREKLNFLLKRQYEKIVKLSTFLKYIKLINDDIEQPEIWCMFCKTTIKSSNSKIACKHIFLHLSYESHIDSINEFWREQRPDREKWKKEHFYLNKNEIEKFLVKCTNVLSENIDGEKNEYQNNIKAPEIKNIIVENNLVNNNNSNILHKNIYTNNNINNSNINNNNGNICNINTNAPYRTVKAYGQNLTCIDINPIQIGFNNVHDNNSIPLWLMDSSDDESNSEDEKLNIKLNINKKKNDNTVIGPPLDLYLAYKKKEKKSKLNPNRLGGTLNRDKKISKNWMPNFGGIWNTGSRSSTRKEFLKKMKK